ncbi:MAG: NifB/NifX family molybdenum-iron cluster-binding protein [Oscillospiraceae bacterium]
MKIAVTYENGQVFQHFGHTEEFKIYEISDKEIVSSEVVSTNGSGHSALSTMLKDMGVQRLICGGIGAGAKNALAAAGIELFCGANGNADKQVEDLLQQKLVFNPDVTCNHHHENGEKCAEHDANCK